MDTVILAVAVLVEAEVVVVIDDLPAVLLDVLLADAVIRRRILEQEGVGEIRQLVAQLLERPGLLAAARQADMPLIDQHQPEHAARRRQLEIAALMIEQAARRLHRQPDAVGALAVKRTDQRQQVAPVLLDQIHARRRDDDLQLVERLHPADVVDVLQDIEMHQQRLTAARRHPVRQQVARRLGLAVAPLAQRRLGEIERQNLVIAQLHRAAHQRVIARQPALDRIARPLRHARFRLRRVALDGFLVRRIVPFAGRGQRLQQIRPEPVVELQFHAAPRSKSTGEISVHGSFTLRRSAQ